MASIKGIVLCGGSGSRLKPLTLVINKHLLPVYNQPMIYWPIQTLVKSGIKDIMLVCGGNNAGDFLRVVGNGSEFGLKHVSYTYQKEPKGIADALFLAADWAANEPICVILGDNILENSIKSEISDFVGGAQIFMTEVDHPEWYGVVTVDANNNVVRITEKPRNPKSKLIAIGLYIYDHTVWEKIDSLTPSRRNELEITDLNNIYLDEETLRASKISGYWGDSGESIDTYINVSLKVKELVNVSAM